MFKIILIIACALILGACESTDFCQYDILDKTNVVSVFQSWRLKSLYYVFFYLVLPIVN